MNGSLNAGEASAAVILDPDTWYLFKVEVVGNKVKAFIDDQLIFDFTGLKLDRGAVGFMDDGVHVHYDDARVKLMSSCNDCTLFSDDFNDGVFDRWTQISNLLGSSGAWSIENGELSSDVGSGAIFGQFDWTDYTVETSIKFPQGAGNDAGLFFRFQDEGNQYQFRVSNGLVRLVPRINGRVSNVLSAAFTINPDQWYRLKVEVKGNQAKAFIDDQLIFTVPDIAIAQGVIGFQDDGVHVHYDDVVVRLCQNNRKTVGTIEPVVKWQWNNNNQQTNGNQVIMAPVVTQANDDNNDGQINTDDIPDIIFGAFSGGNLTNSNLVILSGSDGSEILKVTDPTLAIFGEGNIAVGDIDNDGLIEIIAPAFSGGIIALEHDGTKKWVTDPSVTSDSAFGGASIADLDGDGNPEIIYGKTVINNDGTIRWNGSGQFFGSNFLTFLNAPHSVVADINLDGSPEIVAGASAYNKDGNLL